MDIKIADLLMRAAAAEDIEMDRHNNYSGRGMFGKVVSAVSVPSQKDFVICVAKAATLVPKDKVDIFLEEIREYRTDNLGRDIIFY